MKINEIQINCAATTETAQNTPKLPVFSKNVHVKNASLYTSFVCVCAVGQTDNFINDIALFLCSTHIYYGIFCCICTGCQEEKWLLSCHHFEHRGRKERITESAMR